MGLLSYIGVFGDLAPVRGEIPKAPGQPYVFQGRDTPMGHPDRTAEGY
jgi:hypothetical protein